MASEPYGTTPLPAKGVTIWYDPANVWEVAQQPKSQQIAVYEGSKNEESVHGATILDVNQHFVIYAVKKGLIRILHRHSTLRSLFRGHEGQGITDIRFFLDGDVLGSVGTGDDGLSSVIIWRVFERTPEIMSEKLLEINTFDYTISRLVWHPFNPNQFWIIHTNTSENVKEKRQVASHVETTRITTLPHQTEGHAVCTYHSHKVIMDGVIELADPSASSLTDLDWSEKDVRHVLTTHNGGEIRLWDLRKVENTVSDKTLLPACLCLIQEDQPLSRCKFLPHECPLDQAEKREMAYTNCFLTAANNNTVVTLWSPFCEETPPTKLQAFGLENPSSSYLLDVCYGPSPPDGPPPSLFILMADQSDGKLFAWHVGSEWQEQTVVTLVGCDYVTPFLSSFPMYSWSTQVQPAADISEDDMADQSGLIFDMKLFSYQSTTVQCLILTSFMCLPPESQWSESTPGVRVEDLQQEVESVVASNADLAMSEDFEGEEYDIGEDDDHADANGEHYQEPPEASSLPKPEGLDSPQATTSTTSTNPFANWLGALAGNPAPEPAPIPPPPVAQAQNSTGSGNPGTMLTPADLFPNHPQFGGTSSSNSQQEAKSAQANASSNPDANKKKNYRKGKSPARSTSPAKSKQGGKQNNDNKKGQQQLQPLQGQNITILQRKSEGSSPVHPSGTDADFASSSNVFESDAALAEMFRHQEAAIAREIQRVIQSELKSILLPMIDKKVRDCVSESMRPVMASIDCLGKDGVKVDDDRLVNTISSKVEAPLRAVFAENMKNVMIPAFEAVSRQMFSQVSSSLEKGMAQKSGTVGDADPKQLEAISNQLTTMTSLVQQLTSEVESLRQQVSEQGGRPRAGSMPSSVGGGSVDHQQMLEQEVLALLGSKQYEAAFTKALSASTVEMALFVCRHADLSDVLGGNSPALSQPILLCLMHQLGTSVVTASDTNTNLQTELTWLQEISLSINPADESMRRHLPNVLQQLVTGINNKLARSDTLATRRPLQRLLQVLRGMQIQ